MLSHFDAVVYESGDDFGPQDITNLNPRRMTSATAQTGSQETAPWAHRTMLELRDYANEGGKLIVAGRNVHQPFTGTARASPTPARGRGRRTSCSASTTRTTTAATTTWWAPPSSARARTSNDTWQNYLGVIGRQSGIGVATSTTANNANPAIAGYPVAAKAGGLFDGMGPVVINESSTGDPNQAADGTPLPQPRLADAPAQLGRRQRAAAPGDDPGRLRHPGHLHHDRRRDHLDA